MFHAFERHQYDEKRRLVREKSTERKYFIRLGGVVCKLWPQPAHIISPLLNWKNEQQAPCAGCACYSQLEPGRYVLSTRLALGQLYDCV